jgi:hypothetical protein
LYDGIVQSNRTLLIMSFEKGYKKDLPTKNLYDKDKEVGKVSALPLIFVMQDNSIIYKGKKRYFARKGKSPASSPQ